MAATAIGPNTTFSGLAADRTATLAAQCATGDFYFEEDTGLMYRRTSAAGWEVISLGTLAAGSAVIGKVSIDQTTPGTTDSVTVKSGAFDVQTTITRPANTTAYSANDVVGGALDLGVLGLSAKTIWVTDIEIEGDIATLPTGQNFALAIYSVTPPSAVADNGAWDLSSGDRASFLDYITLGALADLGSTLYARFSNLNRQLKLAGTHLFAYLITPAGFTPAANSEVYKITIHTLGV